LKTSPPESIEKYGNDGNGLRVCFERQSDRWRHWIEWAFSRVSQPLLESVEGCSLDPWPASPPFQELLIDRSRPAGPVAMLLGRGNVSHWSASFELAEGPVRLIADVACHVRGDTHRLGQDVWIGSTYRILPAWNLIELSANRTQLAPKGDATGHVDFQADVGSLHVECEPDRLLIACPQSLQSLSGTATFRWRISCQPVAQLRAEN
jgi:hypothetical protein